VAAVRPALPKLVRFTPEFPPLRGLTSNSSELDRRLLGPVSRAAWDSVVRAVQRSLPDSALDRAVRAIPAAWGRLSGSRIFAVLRARRDRLAGMGERFYQWVH
jgi:hypothetical protein